MKQLLIALSLFVGALTWAQDLVTVAPVAPAASSSLEDQRNAERERLARERRQLEDNYKQDMRLCYQNFDVTSCRLKARDRRIDANAVLLVLFTALIFHWYSAS